MKSFIPEKTIDETLQINKNPERQCVKEILEKARELKGLTPGETATLIQCNDREIVESIFETARFIKESIYGKRLVIFAPLYLSSFCINNCLYCGFRRDNIDLKRKRLSLEELQREVESLEEQGQKRLLLIAGEDPYFSQADLLTKIIDTVYKTKKKSGSIRRVNVNIAPLSVKNFRFLKEAGIGTYQLFQETYNRKIYNKIHTKGPKANYAWRLNAMDRAMKAGIDDVGIGVLFGLYDYRFEVLALLYHCIHLEKRFGVGPHTISVPRIKPALNTPLFFHNPYAVSDEDFKKLVAVLRLAVPYTGMILSTRESPAFRDEILSLGISQISAGSRTSPGAYSEEKDNVSSSGQFLLDDNRTLKEIIKNIIQKGFLPSFCTACYRNGRTGQDFMAIAKPGAIKNYCLPNSLVTFKEYVLDYGGEDLKQKADDIIERELTNIPNISVRNKTKMKLELLEQGDRDLYF